MADKKEAEKAKHAAELAKANGWEVKTTELFSRSNSPQDLDVAMRSSSRGGNAVDQPYKR